MASFRETGYPKSKTGNEMKISSLSTEKAKLKKMSKDCRKLSLLNIYLKVKHTFISPQWFLIKVWD